MSYEEYAKALEGEPLFHVDWKCPKCGADMDYASVLGQCHFDW